MEQQIFARCPQSLSEAELQDFIAMVRTGDEVGEEVLERNVRNAQCLVFLRRNSCLLGVAALKNPLPSYRQDLKEKSGVKVAVSEFRFELGYVFVLPCARRQGISIELTRAALSASGAAGVFATARTDNSGMHATLRRFDFEEDGDPYVSRRGGDHQLQLFVRPAVQPGAAGRAVSDYSLSWQH